MDVSPSSRRTRRAIVEAAVGRWARDPRASLGEIAAAAGVGRTTVHRHYPDRATLLAAVDEDCRTAFGAAVVRARLGDGTALSALHRLAAEFWDLGDHLALVIADDPVVDADAWDDDEDDLVASLVVRGHADGSIDPTLSPEWVTTAFWVLLYASHRVLATGTASRHEVVMMLSTTLATGLGGAD